MKLVIALGNPGKGYEMTPHNIGWVILDAFLNKHSTEVLWEKHHKVKAFVTKVAIKDAQYLFVKPQTYMNKSGEAVRDLLSFYKLSVDQVIVIHDEVDLKLGEIKIATDSGAAGHNGVQNIIDILKTKNFTRLRVGVKTPKKDKIPTEKFVLQRFSFLEQRKIKKVMPKYLEVLDCLIESDNPKTCSQR